jgi:hypothetical protein
MANEIYCTAQLTATKGGAKITSSIGKRQDMTGDDMVQNTQLIGTTSELVVFGEITGAPKQVLITNLDTTNYVELGGDTGITVFSLKLLAGTSALFAPTSATLYAKANTASCRIQILAVEA